MLGKGKVMKVLSILGVFLLAVAIGSYALTPQPANAEGTVGAGGGPVCGADCDGETLIGCSILSGCSGGPYFWCSYGDGPGTCVGGELPCDGPSYCWRMNSIYCVGD